MARFGLESEDEDSGSEVGGTTSYAKTTPKKQQPRSETSGSEFEYDEDDDAPPPRASLMRSDDEEEDSVYTEEEEMDQDDDNDGGRRQRHQSTTQSFTSSRRDASSSQGSSVSSGSRTPSPPLRRRSTAAALPSRRSLSVLSSVANGQSHNNTPWPATLKLEPKRVAVMQASFFHQGVSSQAELRNETLNLERKEEELERKRKLAALQAAAGPTRHEITTNRPHFTAPVVDPAPFRQFRKYTRVELSKSFSAGKEGNLIDAGLMLGRSFRVGWGPEGKMVHLGSMYSNPTVTKSDVVSVDKLKTISQSKSEFATLALRTLTLQLAHTPIYTSQDDSVPFAVTHPELRFSHFVASLPPQDRSPEAHLFRLGQALFDEIEDLGTSDETNREVVERVVEVRRKLRLEQWLEDVVRGSVEEDLRTCAAKGGSGEGARRVFALLTGHQIERACEAAIEGKDIRLATLLAQAGGDDDFREDVYLQLAKWREYRVDAHIAVEYRRVYELLCGNVGLSEGVAQGDKVDGASDVHVAEGLDWKRAFGLHLWYGTFDSTLSTVVQRYENASDEDEKVAPPLPQYLESPALSTPSTSSISWLPSTTERPSDPLFQLLKLYTSPTHPLESVLLPRNFSSSPLDYRLSWHLYILFSRVLRRRDFEDRVEVGDEAEKGIQGNSFRADAVTESYATQLELEGLWRWSVFVLLHLELSERRVKSIKQMLTRHVDDIDEEQFEFLVETLKIPPVWIYAAQAIGERYNGDVFAEYTILLAALQPNEAHKIATLQLAPEAVMRNDLSLLRRLFEPLNPQDVVEWDLGGQIFLDYADCVEELQLQRATSTRLNQTLLDLIHAVPLLLERAPESLKLRVAVSEMSSRLNIISSTLNLHLNAVRPSQLQEADRLVWLRASSASFFEDSVKSAGGA